MFHPACFFCDILDVVLGRPCLQVGLDAALRVEDAIAVHARSNPRWRGVRVMRQSRMSGAMLQHMERWQLSEANFHHHHACRPDEFADGGKNAPASPRWRYCSAAMEMSVQLLLNEAFDYRPLATLVSSDASAAVGGSRVPEAAASQAPPDLPFQLCQDCKVQRRWAEINPDPKPVCLTLAQLQERNPAFSYPSD